MPATRAPGVVGLAGRSVVWALLVSCAAAFIVPEELVSFLSIVYSNIPPVRKGTDSRVGLGFRLGPHADAQIVLELGPQTNTRPLGAAGPNFNAPASSSKRHTALQPLDDRLALGGLDEPPAPAGPSAAAGSNWLSAWRTSVAARRPPARPATNLVDDDIASPEDLSAPGPITLPDPTRLSGAPLVSHLRQLYRKEPERQPEQRQPERQLEQQQPERQVEQRQPVRRQPEQRQPERRPERTTERLRPAALATSKPSKRTKGSGKASGKAAASKQPVPLDLSDVSLD